MMISSWLNEITASLIPLSDELIVSIDQIQNSTSATHPVEYTKELQEIASRAQQLRELLQGNQRPPLQSLDAEDTRSYRHALRAAPAGIVMMIDLWERRQLKAGKNTTASPLHLIRNLARAIIDRITHFQPDHAELLNMQYLQVNDTPSSPGRVLIVDDHADNRASIRESLQEYQHDILEASNGREAIEIVNHQSVDVILLDLFMPEMSGYEVLIRLRKDERLKHVPVVMISALYEDQMAAAAIAAGAEDYLPKPYSPVILQARVTACLERKRLRDREQAYQTQIDRLFRALFPAHIADELRTHGSLPPRLHDHVGVLFIDVVGFTQYCESHHNNPGIVIHQLQDMIARFEHVAHKHSVQKIKTIGDAFLATAGLCQTDPNPVRSLLNCARGMIASLRDHPAQWQVRAAIHVGPVMAGVIGDVQFQYDIWGNTVNLAARLQDAAPVSGIIVSEAARAELMDECHFTPVNLELRGIGSVRAWSVTQ